ncbi:hypothetical protein Zmor_016536 [Zophobas morio]|uniref:Uncharacterized protein n=1 Tax=Zophobas morio TaxID=2755281 RepID=A0AA38MB12_9CUCU|nr:hypothetical protein Zmor_016536 [Zophobas morio]
MTTSETLCSCRDLCTSGQVGFWVEENADFHWPECTLVTLSVQLEGTLVTRSVSGRGTKVPFCLRSRVNMEARFSYENGNQVGSSTVRFRSQLRPTIPIFYLI